MGAQLLGIEQDLEFDRVLEAWHHEIFDLSQRLIEKQAIVVPRCLEHVELTIVCRKRKNGAVRMCNKAVARGKLGDHRSVGDHTHCRAPGGCARLSVWIPSHL